MAYTPVFSQGVKFIKIARIDDQGKDNTLSLQELNSIRIDYSDTGIIEYPVTSISKYNDYFLFGIAPTNATSSTDNEVLNYRFSASYTRDFAVGTSYILNNYIPYGSEAYNNLGYFDMSTGRYTLGNQPNIPISIKVSASITSSADEVTSVLRIVSNLNGIVASQSYLFPTGTTRTVMTSSYTTVPITGEYFYLTFSPGANTQFTGSYFATQSVPPTASVSDLVVLQPYIDEDFYVSEYNVLAGNAVIPRYSALYMDVDYSTNIVQAVNQAQIISGSATRAAVQDSNYTTFANISPRYIGKELSSAKLNEWTFGDISYGKEPNVSNPEINFVSFKSLNGTSPQWGNNNVDLTQVNIEYIINNNNNLTKPINDTEGINLGTIRQTFAEALIDSSPNDNKLKYTPTNATIFLNNVEVSNYDLSTLNGQWPLYKSGYRIEPILYTQTASYDVNGNITGFGYFSTMSFVQGEQGPDTTKNNYMMYAAGTDDIVTLGMALPAGLHFTPTNVQKSASLRDDLLPAYSGSVYNPTGSLANLKTGGYILDFNIYLAATTLDDINDRRGDIIVDWALQKSTDVGVTWTNLATTQTQYYSGTYSRIFYQDANSTTSSLYRVAAINIGPLPNGDLGTGSPSVYLTNKSYFSVTQYPNPGVGTCKAPFWTTGSSANILLASTASDGLNNYRTQKQKDIDKSGFKPINLDFEPQAYDEIRFQGLEQLSFTITNVTESNNKQMILNLDREVPNGVDLNYFLLRRYVDDPSSILLNVNYPIPDNSGSSNSTGNGILKPQYVTSEVNTVIQNTLTQSLI
jgi:hypothetical protein